MLQHETAGDPARLRAALAGLRRYQGHDRAPRPPEMPVIARIGRAAIRDYGGDGPPALFVPSLINPPHVLDLAEGRSLLRWLATQGVRPLLLDWGTPAPEAVSYTHLDVYKRQGQGTPPASARPRPSPKPRR
ncbi:hypothetical protein [Edaphosphingomonas haloaromaticamans]|uniref:Uncharacterized protein n=1 Tax=Edaphosphingomonas haloaromaticamans TaxID=653954 RepID=A0A1S1HBI5_9SPHN|nr:hypothetical protein BHE75_01483 [Sphingomonas haloaromaticamans]